MNSGLGVPDFATLIAEALPAELTEVNGTLLFDLGIKRFSEPFVLENERLTQIVDRLRQLEEHEETALFDERHFEILVRQEGGGYPLLRRIREDGYICRMACPS